ncbi:hypothetical protein CFC21_078508, partial [Triticum aestivum]
LPPGVHLRHRLLR